MSREIHVAKDGNDRSPGTKGQPYRTIQKAAETALPGDTVIVHEGTYREWVRPRRGGNSDKNRITYEAAKGEKVIIKGSEQIQTWKQADSTGRIWKTVIPNIIFGGFNPYVVEVDGDWMIYPTDRKAHTGDVYLNGKSLYEAENYEALKNPLRREDGFNAPWTMHREPLLHPEDSIYQWFAQVGDTDTTIFANFQDTNPNDEFVEINVRKCVFYPEERGMDYITVRGFEMAQAATAWAPPTGDQPGLIGPKWAKGWIIEENIIHDAKCSAISIGKEASTGDNLCTRGRRKPGYQYQQESVFRAFQIGWSKETIGSHIIRNNKIYDCGQNAIVGHLGCIFSEIYNNHIYNIAVKHEYYGYEIAGIKLHAAIDVHIHDNNIHNTTLGIWLDWQAQGTRVSKNLFYANDRDLFIEVTHGPHLVDNNLFLSDYFFDNIAQGGAFVNNLILGTMRREPVLDRATPYHLPHSTKPMGYAFVYSGDDRWYQNIFVGGAPVYTEQSTSGTADYDAHPSSYEEYQEWLNKEEGDHTAFHQVKDAVYIARNAYYSGAKAYNKEKMHFISDLNPNVKIVNECAKTYLEIDVDMRMLAVPTKVMKTIDLGMPRIVEQNYESKCGMGITFDSDYCDEHRDNHSPVGPFAGLREGKNKILVWED